MRQHNAHTGSMLQLVNKRLYKVQTCYKHEAHRVPMLHKCKHSKA